MLNRDYTVIIIKLKFQRTKKWVIMSPFSRLFRSIWSIRVGSTQSRLDPIRSKSSDYSKVQWYSNLQCPDHLWYLKYLKNWGGQSTFKSQWSFGSDHFDLIGPSLAHDYKNINWTAALKALYTRTLCQKGCLNSDGGFEISIKIM